MGTVASSRLFSTARDLWLPVLVTTVAAVLSLAGWRYLVNERREQIREIAADVAAQSRRTIALGVGDHVHVLHNLAAFWGVAGRRPVAEWRANADTLIEAFPSLAYVAWVPPGSGRPRVASGKLKPATGVQIDARETKRRKDERRLIGPERDERGVLGFRVFLPVVGDRGADLGVLEARVNITPMLVELLKESAPGYAIRVYWGDDQVYARGEPATDAGQRWWRQEGELRLPLGMRWTVIHVPTPQYAAAWLTPLPHYLLGAGLLLSFALGAMTNQLRISLARARDLAEGNRALEVSAGELRKLNEALEERVAERTSELEAFNHSISHDLKSPLGAILNYASILEADYRERLDSEALDFLARIRRSARRGGELLDGLLRLSRATHSALAMAEIDMNALARESFAHARALEPDAEVELVLESLPPVRGDRTLVAEVLVNLFDNAIKYSRGQEKRRVAMRGMIEGGECVYAVSDNGLGFDMRYADKLFRVFERLHSSPDIPGTGVGLAVVASIVKRHHGRVWAEGEEDVGARFMFTLPRANP